MKEIYFRTIENCKFYEEQNDRKHLLNEIGCLRGIAYCLEAEGICVHDEAFLHFIELQNSMLKEGDLCI